MQMNSSRRWKFYFVQALTLVRVQVGDEHGVDPPYPAGPQLRGHLPLPRVEARLA